MSDLIRRSDVQMAKHSPFFPKSNGGPWVDDGRVLSELFFINRSGTLTRDALEVYGPHKTLYSRWKRRIEKNTLLK